MPQSLITAADAFLNQPKDSMLGSYLPEHIDNALRNFELSLPSKDDGEHRIIMMKGIIESTASINILSGPPGSAKTYLAAAVMRFYQDNTEHQVIGTAMSEQALSRLQEKSGIGGGTIDDLVLGQIQISQGAIVVIDEAGLLTTGQMIKVLKNAQAQKWSKLLILGDYRQEIPVDQSQPLRVLEDKYPEFVFKLRRGFRQKTEIQQDFVTNLYNADAKKALSALDQEHSILWKLGGDDTLDEAVMAYLKWRSQDDNYKKTALILTQKEQEAHEANAFVQARILTFSRTLKWPLIEDSHAMSIKNAQGLAMDQSFVVITQKVTGQMMVSACSRHRYGIQMIIDQNIYPDLDCLAKDAAQFNLDKVNQAQSSNSGRNLI